MSTWIALSDTHTQADRQVRVLLSIALPYTWEDAVEHVLYLLERRMQLCWQSWMYWQGQGRPVPCLDGLTQEVSDFMHCALSFSALPGVFTTLSKLHREHVPGSLSLRLHITAIQAVKSLAGPVASWELLWRCVFLGWTSQSKTKTAKSAQFANSHLKSLPSTFTLVLASKQGPTRRHNAIINSVWLVSVPVFLDATAYV